MEIPHEFYAITKEGFMHYSINSRFIGPQISLLEPLTKYVTREVYGITGSDVLSVSQVGVSLSRDIDHLSIHTFYRPVKDINDKVILVPVFQQPGAEMNFRWEPPGSMKLYVICFWESTFIINGAAPKIYLVAKDTTTRKTFLLPLPNLYEDARICLGNELEDFIGKSGVDQLGLAIAKLQTAKWNTDLLRSVHHEVESLFRFDPDGKQLPPAAPWTTACRAVNHHAYQYLGKIK